MAFDLSEYVDVKTRLKQALALYPQLRIVEHRPEITQVGDQLFIECSVTVSRDPDDPIPVTAYIFEPYPGKTTFTKNSEQANGATSVLGRALGYMGLGIDKSIASSNEVLGRQEAAEERTKVVSIARPTPVLDGPRSKEIGSARLTAREQTESSQTSNTGGATPNQIKMLTQMCAERGLDFDPTAPMTYSEAKDMFLAIKPIPKVK
tara:strand:+ start:183 stop:800 length:618 start_codon:yes stop_codon:yes gene_type:complete